MKHGIEKFATLALRTAATVLVSAAMALPAHAQVKIIVGSTVSSDVSEIGRAHV